MKPSILVARSVFPDVVDRLREYFEVEDNPEDRVYSKAELIQRLQGKVGAFTTGSVPIDAEVLDANPQLRVVCNMAVGYNNFDVAACTARGVLCTNTTEQLVQAGRVLDIPVQDHIIIGRGRYLSFAEAGLL